jgi:chromosome segregation ATPase
MRDGLIQQNTTSKAERTFLERKRVHLNEQISRLANDNRIATEQCHALTQMLHELRAQTARLSDEQDLISRSTQRYQRIRVTSDNFVDVRELRDSISAIEAEIVEMEREILELRDALLVKDRIGRARERRSKLIAGRAELADQLKTLTL